MKVKAPSEKNFRRAKVKPGRRKSARSWVSWRAARLVLVLFVVSYAAYRGFALVLSATVLQVSRIAVSGNERLSRGEVQQLAHGLYGANILTVHLSEYRRALLDSPWVADAALRRVLPSTIEISVVERRPFGISRLRNQLYLMDRDGTVIDEFGPQYAEFDLPIVDGVVRAPRNGKPAIDPARAQLAARVVDSVSASPSLARRLSQIDVSDLHNAIVLLDDDPARLYLGEESFRERLLSYLEVSDAIREGMSSEIEYVDLRFGQRVFAGQRKGPTGTSGKPSKSRRSY